MPRHTLEDYLSTEDAMAYLESNGTPVSEGTFIKHVHEYRHIVPIALGTRIHRQTGEASAMSVAFTKRMLDQYATGNWPVHHTDAEANGIIDLVQLGEMTGYGKSSIKQRVFIRKQIGYKTIGRVTVVLRRDAEKMPKAKERK